MDTPSGPLKARAIIQGKKVESVTLEMVPSFVFATGQYIDVDRIGRVEIDLVFMGGYFAMVSAESLGIELVPENSQYLISLGMAVIDAANEQCTVFHPERQEVSTIDVTEFYKEEKDGSGGTGAVVYGESHLDRSPCGTGTAAKMTLLHHKGKLSLGETYRNRSPLGTVFTGEIAREEKTGDFTGVVCQVSGNAHVTGCNSFVIDKSDPFQEGFLVV